MSAPPYTPEELMAVVISREVRDYETAAVGAVSPIPAAGCLLAQHTHAPHASIIILGSREYHPFLGGSADFHFLAQQGKLDLFFLSGLQIDREGNINLHCIGDYRSPSLRMHGAYGSAMLYYMAKRVILFRTEHTRRSLVERVDFVTAAGITPERVYRPGGPSKLVTPKALLAFNRERKGWELESLHPGVTLEDVKANTGFELILPPEIKTTPPPKKEELEVLRTLVKERLMGIYPSFAREKLL